MRGGRRGGDRRDKSGRKRKMGENVGNICREVTRKLCTKSQPLTEGRRETRDERGGLTTYLPLI